MKKITPEKKQAIQEKLLHWFEENQRDLPWREHYEPYAVWISEIMLQQTQVKTALPYFHRWMKELPTVKDVAESSEDKILKLWEGLGYYSRARNLQKAAKVIMEKHDGVFPEDYDSILALPGIGKYTAAAISSIAFEKDEALVDGNVIRVLARLMGFKENTRLPENEKKVWELAEALLPKGEARNFNQALMEFGALMCTPKAPKCMECPVQKNCSAYEKNEVEQIPNRGPKKEHVKLDIALGIIKKSNKIFIQKRPSTGLMGGLWEFPGGKIEAKEKPEEALKREIKEEVGIEIKNIKKLKIINHAYTKFKVKLHCYEADFENGEVELKAATDGKWVELNDLNEYPFPAANVQLIADLIKNGGA